MENGHIYELRRGTVVLCSSTVPGLGYGKEILKDMRRNGILLYCDGKRADRGSGA